MSYAVVLPAGGLGKRVGGEFPKQLQPLMGRPMYTYSLEMFLRIDEIQEVVLAVPADWESVFREQLLAPEALKPEWAKKLKITLGAEERWLSVRKGVEALSSDAEYVLVHDVARPLLSEAITREVMHTVAGRGACIAALSVVDTVKIVREGKIMQTIPREDVWLAQTPQAAKVAVLKELYAKMDAAPLDFLPTDEASILEHFKESVFVVPGDFLNDKITTLEDFTRFENFLKFKTQAHG
ncbi:MAG: 2-C-methyl-D-erythritol 4-phosphate cytidylyltransferase [Fibrobacter sp.]|jgi:2-C-methyl-D-erythritol 4-phosphate cytidylyltransferase|nr:2-C-methyl-D-erythritol 4-phosphate cytidylyltransferase [Fibrobacter sp.]